LIALIAGVANLDKLGKGRRAIRCTNFDSDPSTIVIKQPYRMDRAFKLGN
jgi:hypothetical protein